MIFSAPRFVVVDDKEAHLRAIVDAFQLLGSPCIGIQFKPEQELSQEHFRSVRALFLDLHLLDGVAKTDNKTHYGQIAGILEDNISPNGGPFVLVIWTEHPQHAEELAEYLDASLNEDKPYARPLAVLALAKDQFINVADGVVKNPNLIRDAVREALMSIPQLAALLSWESDVLAAAGDTLASLLSLVPADRRSNTDFPGAVDEILSRLACETLGAPHVEGNHRFAITTALAPILTDRIINQGTTGASTELWSNAITRHGDKRLPDASPEEAGRINRMLHLATPGPENIKANDWGAVVTWPYEWNDDALSSRMGLKTGEMLGGQFTVNKADRAKCAPVLVRIGAACDYAQDRMGPIKYLFGVEIPLGVTWLTDKAGNDIKMTDAIWRSPVFVKANGEEPFRLYVHVRFPLTVLPDACGGWEVRYRIREQLLMHLVSADSNYGARPGIVQLPAK